MQSVKLFMRVVGVPNPALGIVSAEEAEEAMQYQYLSAGYQLLESHYLGEVRGDNGSSQGYKMMFVLVKNEPEPEPVKAKAK